MRNTTVWLLLILTCSSGLLGRSKESVDELKARLDNAKPEQRIDLGIEIARRQLDAANQLYSQGHIEEARKAIADITDYSEKAGHAAAQTGKKLKHTEIALRKLSNKLRDIKRTLNFEDQAPVQEAIDHLEQLRTNLLTRMFPKGKEGKEE